MPETAIEEKDFDSMIDQLNFKPIQSYLEHRPEEAIGESGCTNDTCQL